MVYVAVLAVPTIAHGLVKPLIVPGVDGKVDRNTLRFLAVLVPQPADCTEILVAETKLLLKLTVIMVSFTPVPPGCEVIVAPVGTVQTYDNALDTLRMVYTASSVEPMNWHALVEPVIAPGVDGEEAVIDRDLSLLLPQLATDLTFNAAVIYPALNVTIMLLVPCPLTKLTLAGNVHK